MHVEASRAGEEGSPEPVFSPDDQPLPRTMLLKKIVRIIIPTDVSSFLWMSAQTITLVFVGRNLGQLCVAQYSAGIIVFNMMGFSIIYGFGAAIDTISAQAYGRDRHSPVVGETMQMALALNLTVGAIISVLFWFIEPIAVWVFGDEVGPGVALFLRYSPLYMLVQIISGVMSKTMFAQNAPEIVTLANLVAACTSPIANYFLTPLGLHGAALSLFMTVGCCCVTHALCCLYHPRIIVREAPWPSPRLLDKDAWTEFLRVAIPSVLATCAEWWAFEVQAILAIQISPLALAVQGIAMNLVAQLFSVALGVSVAASVLVGNSLGGMCPVQAKQFAYFVFFVDLAIGAITAVIMTVFGGHIARIFSKEVEVVAAVERIMPFVILCHLGDSFQFCLLGVFRGSGMQKQASIAVLATLWGVGVPASVILVKVFHTGVEGCIGGLLIGFLFEVPVLFYWMTRFKWEKLAVRAQRGWDVEAFVEDQDELMSSQSDTTNEKNETPHAPKGKDAISMGKALEEELPIHESM